RDRRPKSNSSSGPGGGARSISAVAGYSRVRTEEFTVVGAESSAISVLDGATPHISLKMSGQIPVEAAPIVGCDDWPLDLYRRFPPASFIYAGLRSPLNHCHVVLVFHVVAEATDHRHRRLLRARRERPRRRRAAERYELAAVAVGTRVISRPPAQIRTCSFPAYGSYLGSQRQMFAVCAPAHVTRLPGTASPSVLCWFACPLARALGSTRSAADRSALSASFAATMAESDFPRPCIIGYGSSPSQCGPEHFRRWSDAGYPRFRRDPFARDVAFDPGGTTMPRIMALHMLRSTMKTVSAPAISSFRGSIPPPTHPLCTLRVRRCRRLTQHSLPGGPLRPYLGRTFTA